MSNIFRGTQAQVNRSDLSGRRVWKGAGGVDWSLWFDHFWQAKGAADYATSLVDQVGVQNLVEGNGAVPWGTGTGWGFVDVLAQWLDTGLVPAVPWSMMIQFDSLVIGNRYICGNYVAVPFSLFAMYSTPAPGCVWYNQGNHASLPPLGDGNMCIAGKNAYRNGMFDGIMGGAGALPIVPIYLGALNQQGAGAILFTTVDIIAVGINTGPALTAPQVAAAAAAMAAL